MSGTNSTNSAKNGDDMGGTKNTGVANSTRVTKQSPWRSVASALSFVGPRWPLYVLALLFGIVGGFISGPAIAWVLASLVESVVAVDLAAVSRTSFLLLASAASLSLCYGVSEYLTSRVSEGAASDMRDRVFASAVRAKVSYFDTHKVGDVVSVMTNDVEAAKRAIRVLQGMVTDVAATVSAIVIIMVWMPQVLLAVAVLGVFCTFIGSRLAGPVGKVSDVYQKGLEESTSLSVEAFGGLAVVKSLGAEKTMLGRLSRVIQNQYRTGSRRAFLMGVQSGVSGYTQVLSTVTIAFVSGRMVMSGKASLGQVIAVFQLVGTPLAVLANLASSWTALQQDLAGVKRVVSALEIPQEEDAAGLGAAEVGRGGSVLEFDGVSFGYDGGEAVLDGASFAIAEGQKVAIVGPSGSGKSSILKLIQRLYQPSSGTIRFRGFDIASAPLSHVRRQVGFVAQEPFIFPGDVEENIRMGNQTATRAQVESAAEMANVHRFIENLPSGYETILDERGGNLSGGEKQRICLARAFLKGADVLLLDEPTSSVDGESEALIRQSIERYAQNATVLLVSHADSMAEGAEMVLHVEGGDISVAQASP